MRDEFLRVAILSLVVCKLLLTSRAFQGCKTQVSDWVRLDPATIRGGGEK